MKRFFAGLFLGLLAGFFLGVYMLPIIIEWQTAKQAQTSVPTFLETDQTGRFNRDSPGSDPLHWGEGNVRVSGGKLIFEDDVQLAPGPDYRIYLTKKFVDTRKAFRRIKPQSIEVAKLKTFSGPLEFELPEDVNIDVFDNVVVWCEAFSMYIASARLE